MMAAVRSLEPHLLESPAFDSFRERLRPNADLSKTNWFRVGGPAEWLFRPEHTEDLSAFLKLLPPQIPVTVLGVGSNVIVRDGGIDGVVVRLGRGFTDMQMEGGKIAAGAVALGMNLALFACEHGISGLEFLSGIPGTVGGAVRMNAGAYGSEVARVLVEAEVVARDGMIRRLSHEQLGFTYRNSMVSAGTIVTRAWFLGQAGNKEDIARKMKEIAEAREETQPVRARTGGSTFKNPAGHKAWELIDKAGCRGLTVGGAQVSEKHCNFFINTGDATAKDLEALGDEVIRRVKDKTGVTLEWEIKRIGNRE